MSGISHYYAVFPVEYLWAPLGSGIFEIGSSYGGRRSTGRDRITLWGRARVVRGPVSVHPDRGVFSPGGFPDSFAFTACWYCSHETSSTP